MEVKKIVASKKTRKMVKIVANVESWKIDETWLQKISRQKIKRFNVVWLNLA